MKTLYLTPGPSQMHPRFKEFMTDAFENDIFSISHRSKEFEKIYQSVVSNIKKIFNVPEDFYVFFLASGTETMERIIQNCVAQKSYHFVNGSFSQRFYDTSIDLGKQAKKYEVDFGNGFIEIPKNISYEIEDSEIICFTQNETSSGVMTPLSFIKKINKNYDDKIFVVDVVSSAPYVNLDFSYIDIAFFSIQKGFGLPAGLGVMIVNERSLKKANLLKKRGFNIGSYHSFPSLYEMDLKNQNPETPNVMAIYMLDRVCVDYLAYGIEKIRKETEKKADMIYDFFDKHAKYKPFVKEEKLRSKTVITIETGDATQDILKNLQSKGLIVGAGYGQFKDNQIRIANFPMSSVKDIERLLKIF